MTVLALAWLSCACDIPRIQIDIEPAPAVTAEPVSKPAPAMPARVHALCVVEPEPGAAMCGSPTDAWAPACDGLAVTPCELGVDCGDPRCPKPRNCACVCKADSDCEESTIGMAAYGGPAGRSSWCEAGRCAWGDV